jgi:hypothetical protein
VDVSKVILPLAREVALAETVLVSVPPVNVTVLVVPPAPYFVVIAVWIEVILIAGLIVKVATVEVSTTVKESESEKVTIARYLNLFIAVVKVVVVKVSVVKPVPFVEPLPAVISIQETEATAVTVSVATCHLTDFVKGEESVVVPTVNESVIPAVVVSLAGCRLIVGFEIKYLTIITPDPPCPRFARPEVEFPPPPPPVFFVPAYPFAAAVAVPTPPAPPPPAPPAPPEVLLLQPAPPPPPP